MLAKAASVMFLGQVASTGAIFLRNILVAKLLSVEEFGLASSFAIMFALIEATTDVGLDRLVVQDRDGNKTKFMGTLHSLQILRGIIGAALMLVVAYPYAGFLNTPEVTWAYQAMALIPLMRGALHLDMYRFQRQMRFAPVARTMAGSPLASLCVALLSYLVTPDFRVMLWAILAHQAIFVLLSHLQAENRYRLNWDREYLHRAVRFGMPMLFNGAAIFLIFNGDRLIVGNQLGLTVLGLFSAAYMLSFTPTMMISVTMNSVLLPRLSKVQDDSRAFANMGLVSIEIGLVSGALAALGIALAGPLMLFLFFGDKYEDALLILLALGVVQGVRVAKTGYHVAGVAKGRTILPLWANIARILALPVGYFVLEQGGGVLALVLVALGGEILSFAVSQLLAARWLGIPLRPQLLPLCLFFGLMVLILGDMIYAPPELAIWSNFHWLQLLLLAAFAVQVSSAQRLLAFVRSKGAPLS